MKIRRRKLNFHLISIFILSLIIGLIILSLLLLNGCIQIDIYQKIKRNGHVDISLTFKAESSMILNALKQDLEIEPSLIKKHTLASAISGIVILLGLIATDYTMAWKNLKIIWEFVKGVIKL